MPTPLQSTHWTLCGAAAGSIPLLASRGQAMTSLLAQLRFLSRPASPTHRDR